MPILFRILLLSIPVLIQVGFGQSFFRIESSADGIKEKALEVKHSLAVLTLSLSPGDEDFVLLADLRMSRGAYITSAYVTNGESGASDLGTEYPNALAALRRFEASSAMQVLGVEARFLNVPAIGSAWDSSTVFRIWDRDTVEHRIMRLISSTRPSLIVLFRERSPEPSAQWLVLKDLLMEAVRRLQPPKSVQGLARLAGVRTWEPERVIIPVASSEKRPVSRYSSKTSVAGEEARKKYESLKSSFALRELPVPAYEQILPVRRQLKDNEAGLPMVPRGLGSLSSKITRIADDILRNKSLRPSFKIRKLKETSAVMDSVDYLIGREYSSMPGKEQKTLLLWKEGLQNLKNQLLGISVYYSLTEKILTYLQVTSLTVDSVKGVPEGADLWLYFPAVRDNWIFNETRNQRLPLTIGAENTLVTPGEIPFNLPAQLEGLREERVYTPVPCFLVHSAKDRADSFIIKFDIPFQFAPKLTTEVLTPIVRAVDDESVVVRITNHSRDGLVDRVWIEDSLVSSPPAEFALRGKESTSTQQLTLHWKKQVAEGSYVIPIIIGGSEADRFAARAFDVSVDTTLRVGLITSVQNSGAGEALKRLGIKHRRSSPRELTKGWFASFDVVIVDHRLLTLDSTITSSTNDIVDFVRNGGRVIVLAQDAKAWNRHPLMKGISLDENLMLDPFVPLEMDSTNRVFFEPNRVTLEDWENWLWRVGHNSVTVSNEKAEIVLSAVGGKYPLLVKSREESGIMTYVDLALEPQWLNIHAGAFRLLANLLSQ